MITEETMTSAEEITETINPVSRELVEDDILNDEPRGLEFEGVTFEEPAAPQGNSRGLNSETLAIIPGRNEDWYVYKTGENWSSPFPMSFLAARAAAGVLDSKTYIKKLDENNLPCGKQKTIKEVVPPELLESPRTARTVGGASNTLKSISGHAKTAADSLKTFADTIDGKDLKSLANVKNLLKVSKGLSRLSAGLGMLGAVLGVISLLTGEESDTDKILNAIDKLDKKIDSLQTAMLDQFDKLKNIVEVESAKTQLRPHLNVLRSVKDLVLAYQKAAKDPTQRQIAVDRLLDFDRKDVQMSVEAIFSQCTGRDQATNILEATYNKTFGSMLAVTDIGASLYSFACFGYIADSLIGTLERTRDGGENAEAARQEGIFAKNLYNPMIEGIYAAWESFSNRCENEFEANMISKVQTEIFPRMNASLHEASVKDVRNKLRDQWFWKDWCAIIYDNVSGLNNHGFKGWGVKSWFRQTVSNGQVNMMVKWVDKTVAASGKNQWNTHGTIKVINPAYDWFDSVGLDDDPAWINKTVTTQDLDWKNVETAFNRMNSQISHPGMVWMCRRGKGVYYASTNANRRTWKNGKYFTICIFK